MCLNNRKCHIQVNEDCTFAVTLMVFFKWVSVESQVLSALKLNARMTQTKEDTRQHALLTKQYCDFVFVHAD